MANVKAKIRQTNTLKGSTSKNNEIVAQTVKLSQGSISLGDLSPELKKVENFKL